VPRNGILPLNLDVLAAGEPPGGGELGGRHRPPTQKRWAAQGPLLAGPSVRGDAGKEEARLAARSWVQFVVVGSVCGAINRTATSNCRGNIVVTSIRCESQGTIVFIPSVI
jgi:hypothetical protein